MGGCKASTTLLMVTPSIRYDGTEFMFQHAAGIRPLMQHAGGAEDARVDSIHQRVVLMVIGPSAVSS